MTSSITISLFRQFGASLTMLKNAVAACPDTLWNDASQFWYLGYHTIFYVDYYLSEDPLNFLPPSPYTLSEFDPKGKMPDRVYSKTELLTYIDFCFIKLERLLGNFSVDDEKRFQNGIKDYSMFEMIIYNMRHVQHHTGQLNMLIRQYGSAPPRWVSDIPPTP